MKAHSGDIALAWEDTGSGSPVLLIHGLGYARWGWEPLLPLLAERHRVVSFDNRGIGESSVPPGPYTAEMMAGDALAVLDAAGVEKAHVVGTSLGGMIAQELALAYPKRVDRLILVATTPGAPGGRPMPAVTVRLLAEASQLEPEVALRRFVENALGREPDPALVDTIMGRRMAQPQDPAGWAAQAAAGTGYAGGDRAGDIAAPTLIVTGTADRVVDPANSDLLGEMIPDARVEKVPDAGHLVFWEHPALVAELINDFLA
jgi:3-oxoadipate enol-lactonase